MGKIYAHCCCTSSKQNKTKQLQKLLFLQESGFWEFWARRDLFGHLRVLFVFFGGGSGFLICIICCCCCCFVKLLLLLFCEVVVLLFCCFVVLLLCFVVLFCCCCCFVLLLCFVVSFFVGGGGGVLKIPQNAIFPALTEVFFFPFLSQNLFLQNPSFCCVFFFLSFSLFLVFY